ncbi:btb poz domain containing [Lecanosticta acicola]|uniref:Btb poz domain containing n=1 Tax=Lecanosticta acicola TaxID=111012 RepID=A0AAI8W2B0_9PEZI|nr:btb poz domain containing [Lecanosticta acicola]
MASTQKRDAVPSSACDKTDYTKTLSVLVGPEEVSFMVHEHVICAKSKFFEAISRNDWKERQDRVVRLPEVLPYCFALYIHWLYTGTIAFHELGFEQPLDAENNEEAEEEDEAMEDTTDSVDGHDEKKSAEETSTQPDDESWHYDYCDLFYAYTVGDWLQDRTLTNYAMTECIRMFDNYDDDIKVPNSKQISWVWPKLSKHSVLRKWLLDFHPTSVSPEEFAEELYEYPSEYVAEAALKLVKDIAYECAQGPTRADACDYHEHSDGSDCPYAKQPQGDTGADDLQKGDD